METQAIIDDYVNKVAANLPRKLRNDIGLELHTLLTEQLESAARAAGHAPDSGMALDILRRFGQPDDVAARYAERGFPLIDPDYSPVFVKLAVACVALQWALTLPAVFASRLALWDWVWGSGFGALSWVGLLVLWFGLASWIQRRSPVDPDTGVRPWTHWILWVPFPGLWHPGKAKDTQWRAARNSAPLGAVLTIFFIAPAWILGHLLPAGTDTSWVRYDKHFEHWLLLPLLALMAVRLVLFAAAVLDAQRRARTESLRVGLWVSFVVLLYYAEFSGHFFAHPATDAIFKAWLLVYMVVNTIALFIWFMWPATRVRVPTTLAPR